MTNLKTKIMNTIKLLQYFIPGKRCFLACLMIIISYAVNAQDKKVAISLDFSEKGDQKFINATAREYTNDSIGGPVEELDLYFYVERTFSLLPIGDVFNTTDENGQVSVEFPGDLPADPAGNVNLIVKVQESDIYRDTSVNATKAWGIPAKIEDNTAKRTLWAAGANAPISLLILVNSLIAIAWGIIIYIVFKFYSISKM